MSVASPPSKHPSVKGAMKYGSAVALFPITRLSDLPAMGGVMVSWEETTPNGNPNRVFFGWLAGVDLLTALAGVDSAFSLIRRVIRIVSSQSEFGIRGPHNGSYVSMIMPSYTMSHNRLETLTALRHVEGSERIWGIKTRLWSGAGYFIHEDQVGNVGPIDGKHYGDTSHYEQLSHFRLQSGTGVVSNRIFGGAVSGAASGNMGSSLIRIDEVLGAGRIRLPGGASWASRIDQFYNGMIQGAPREIQGKVAQVVSEARVKLHEYLRGAFNLPLDHSADVYPIVLLMRDGSVKLVPASAQSTSPTTSASVTVRYVQPWGTRGSLPGSAHIFTIVPRHYGGSNATSSASGQGYIWQVTGTGAEVSAPSAATAASYSDIRSIDGVHISFWAGSLGGPSEEGADITSTGVWNEAVAAINYSSSPAAVNEERTTISGAMENDQQYVTRMQSYVDQMSTANTGLIGATNWGKGVVGLDTIIGLADLHTLPKKARRYEALMHSPYFERDAIALDGTSTSATADVKDTSWFNVPFTDDPWKCMSSLM